MYEKKGIFLLFLLDLMISGNYRVSEDVVECLLRRDGANNSERVKMCIFY